MHNIEFKFYPKTNHVYVSVHALDEQGQIIFRDGMYVYRPGWLARLFGLTYVQKIDDATDVLRGRMASRLKRMQESEAAIRAAKEAAHGPHEQA